jgi:16S rRNA (adenine1518-N6/adenine1519-N6)-dimethyltransferase
MKVCNPKYLQEFLAQNGLQAKKKSSQNFLIDGNIIRKIIQQAQVEPCDIVIEIGPGPGALTEALLETGCEVWAIEKDPKLAGLLRRLCPDEKKLQIFTEDFLSFALEQNLQKALLSGKKAKVVANLPYHITTPILIKLIPLHTVLSDVVVMMQKEVAERCTSSANRHQYGSLSLFLQFFSKPKFGFTVDANCFLPKPSVQSAVVHFQLAKPPAVLDQDFLFVLIRTAFGKRRKMLKTSLKEILPTKSIEEILQKNGLNPQLRPEELSLQQFIDLSSDFLAVKSPYTTP